MGNNLAKFLTYTAMLVDGNPISNRCVRSPLVTVQLKCISMSIGAASPQGTGTLPEPAVVGGLDTHGLFEGDASMTRNDAFFGDNHSFNETLFEQACCHSATLFDRCLTSSCSSKP